MEYGGKPAGENNMASYRLTDFNDFNVNNIRFGDIFEGTYKKIIPIGLYSENDDVNPFILSTPANLLTFGVQEIYDRDRKNVIGYQLPICLWGKKRVSHEERLFTTKLEELLTYVKEFLVSIKDELQIDDDMINGIQILNWKYENGVRCEDKGPILYSKLLLNNRTQKLLTTFIDEDSNSEINPLSILNQKGTVRSAIKIENIIIGKKIIIQMKLFEVLYHRLPNSTEKTPYVKRSLLNPNINLKKIKKDVQEPTPIS